MTARPARENHQPFSVLWKIAKRALRRGLNGQRIGRRHILRSLKSARMLAGIKCEWRMRPARLRLAMENV